MASCQKCCYGWEIMDCFSASMEACFALVIVFVLIFAILGTAYGFLAAAMDHGYPKIAHPLASNFDAYSLSSKTPSMHVGYVKENNTYRESKSGEECCLN
ncbi:hypothetical protein ACFX13_004844 [Malus domestica]